jgi:hypothetical protein
MAKRGRPIKENARRVQFRLRMNDRENSMLKSICEYTGLTRPDVLRIALERMYEEEDRLRKAFSEPLKIGKDTED